jgi:hypothetical protein
MTERQKVAILAALTFAAVNIDDLNEAFEDEGKVTFRKKEVDVFTSEEMDDLISLVEKE